MAKYSTYSLYLLFFYELNYKRKVQLLILVLLMFFASFAEMLSVSAIIPFVAIITNPFEFIEYANKIAFLSYFELNKNENYLQLFTFIFIILLVFSGSLRLLLMWAQIQLSSAIGTDFSVKVYEKTLNRKYSYHLKTSSSVVLAGSQKAKEIADLFIYPLLSIISSVLIFLTVLGTLLIINTKISLIALVCFCAIYLIIIFYSRNTVKNNSKVISEKKVEVTRLIQEGLGGIKEVIINNYQKFYTKRYEKAFTSMQQAVSSNSVIAQSPRFIVETLGMIVIVMLAYYLSSEKSSSILVLPTLSAVALGAQRLLPLLQQIYSSYITIRGAHNGTEDAFNLLKQDNTKQIIVNPIAPISFEHSITLRNISFSYFETNKSVLNNINIVIPKGIRLGIIGETGSGKSTLVDIIMGLLSPDSGKVYIDDIEINNSNVYMWREFISQVPQSIFLIEASVAENIAFGKLYSEINMERVIWASQKAQIANVIDNWPDKYNTNIGERGIRLSGGQRQRIGIARALYKNSKVLIFDEATSALDNNTENNVMNFVDSLHKDITLIIIAHRLTTLKKCDMIIEIKDGMVRNIKNDLIVK